MAAGPIQAHAGAHSYAELEAELAAARREIKRFRTLVMANAVEVWATDAQGQTTQVICDDGRSPHPSPVGPTALRMEAVHPDDLPQLAQVIATARATEKPFEISLRGLRADGQWHNLHVRGFPVHDETGKLEEWIGVADDVSKQARYEAENKELTERLQSAFQTAVAELSERKRVEDVLVSQNAVLESIAAGQPLSLILSQIVDSIEKLLAGTKGSVLLLDDQNALTLSAAPSLPDDYKAATARLPVGPNAGSCGIAAFSGQTVIVEDIGNDPRWDEFRDVALQNGLRACWSVPILSRDRSDLLGTAPRVLGTFAMYRDQASTPSFEELQVVNKAAYLAAIAIEREQSGQALRESEYRFRQFADSVDDLFWIADADSQRAIYHSPAYAKVFGCEPPAESDLPSIAVGVHPEDLLRVHDGMSELFSGRSGALQYRVVRPDGETRWVFNRWFPIRRADGTLWRVAGTLKDITDRVQAEERLANQGAELCHASRISSLGLMAAALSHEINQPLNAISNYAATSCLLLQSDRFAESRSELIECLQKVDAAALQAGEIVRCLRSFVRKDKARQTHCDFHRVLQDAMELTRAELRSRKVRVQCDLGPHNPTVLGNAVQLQQVIINLLTNAADAMADQPPTSRQITIRSVVSGQTIRCLISDKGPGFSQEIKDRLFEPFLTTKAQGSGIGLSICRSILEDHGGMIEIAESSAAGATIVIELPLTLPLTA